MWINLVTSMHYLNFGVIYLLDNLFVSEFYELRLLAALNLIFTDTAVDLETFGALPHLVWDFAAIFAVHGSAHD
mgnify:CR=1 FL=1